MNRRKSAPKRLRGFRVHYPGSRYCSMVYKGLTVRERRERHGEREQRDILDGGH